jgi:hypothetical protein
MAANHRPHWRGQPGSLGKCDGAGFPKPDWLTQRLAARGTKPTVALPGDQSGPWIYGGMPDRVTLPANGPERRAGLPPCGTKLTGRKCGKRVVHRYPDGWHCVSCGVIREVSDG